MPRRRRTREVITWTVEDPAEKTVLEALTTPDADRTPLSTRAATMTTEPLRPFPET